MDSTIKNLCMFQEFPMQVTVSLKLKNTLIARLQPVSFEINRLLLLFGEDVADAEVDDVDVGVDVEDVDAVNRKSMK